MSYLPFMKPYYSPNTVILRNPIAMSKYKLSSMQQKVFIEVALHLKNNPAEKLCKILVRDFYDKIGIKTNDHNELYAQIRQMQEVIIHIPKSRHKGQVAYIDASIFASVEVGADKFNRATIEIEVSEKLKPYFVEIVDGDFFSYKIENTRKLKSPQSIKMYLYLRSWAWIGRHKIQYAELRDILGIDINDYQYFKDFRVRVLDKAQKEIHEKTDLRFEYVLFREVHTNPNTPVHEIEFAITSPPSEEAPVQLEIFVPDDVYKLYCEFEVISIEDYQAFIKRLRTTSERLHDVLLLAQSEKLKGNNIRSIQPYVISALKSQGAKGFSARRKEATERVRINKEIETAIRGGLDDFKQRYFIQLGSEAPQEIKNTFWASLQEEIAKRPKLKDVYFDGDIPKADAIRESLGAVLAQEDSITDHQLSLLYMESLGKSVLKEKGFWEYSPKSANDLAL